MNINIKNFNLTVVAPSSSPKTECKSENRNEVATSSRCFNRVSIPTDGIYLIYANGSKVKFTLNEPNDGVKYIGLKYKDISFAISLKEHKDVVLLDDGNESEQESPIYYSRECDALFDFNGAENTKRLVERNMKLRDILDESEYIPSLGELNIMAHFMKDINMALEYVGGDLLASAGHWSSTEGSQGSSWYVYFGYGGTGTGSKSSSIRVRAVAAFTFSL